MSSGWKALTVLPLLKTPNKLIKFWVHILTEFVSFSLMRMSGNVFCFLVSQALSLSLKTSNTLHDWIVLPSEALVLHFTSQRISGSFYCLFLGKFKLEQSVSPEWSWLMLSQMWHCAATCHAVVGSRLTNDQLWHWQCPRYAVLFLAKYNSFGNIPQNLNLSLSSKYERNRCNSVKNICIKSPDSCKLHRSFAYCFIRFCSIVLSLISRLTSMPENRVRSFDYEGFPQLLSYTFGCNFPKLPQKAYAVENQIFNKFHVINQSAWSLFRYQKFQRFQQNSHLKAPRLGEVLCFS